MERKLSYSDLGFSSNPFNTRPLQATEFDATLLVGRDSELERLQRRIRDTDKIPTLDGVNGIGKTSIANIACFNLFKEANADISAPLIIPCRKSFQLSDGDDVSVFEDDFWLQIAQTLIENETILRPAPGCTQAGVDRVIKDYLQSPVVRNFSVSAFGFGGGYGASRSSSSGFDKVGFRAALLETLSELFPTSKSGGVVCILDNLELLQSSKSAKDTVEALRDTVLSAPGVKWVLCGASGVVRGVANSPRMTGKLHGPILINDIDDQAAGEIFDSRVRAFRNGNGTNLPITRENFLDLFYIMNGNTRFTLNEADEFCMWVFDNHANFTSLDQGVFDRWVEYEIESVHDDIFVNMGSEDLSAFRSACRLEIFAASDYIDIGFDNKTDFHACMDRLSHNGLIFCSLDLDDDDLKVFELSSKGFKLQYLIDNRQ